MRRAWWRPPTPSMPPRWRCTSSTSAPPPSAPVSMPATTTRPRAIAALARLTGLPLRPARNRFRVTQSMGDIVAYSGALRRLAVELGKIASDLRLLSMGPRAGIAEIRLPAVQPGSSIMPGKVNPSIPEMVNQVCYQVYGCDTTVTMAGDAGQLELNVMMPVIAWNALHAQRILTTAMEALDERTVAGIEADRARCRELLERSTAMATALSPYIGYAATAEIAKASVASGRSIRDAGPRPRADGGLRSRSRAQCRGDDAARDCRRRSHGDRRPPSGGRTARSAARRTTAGRAAPGRKKAGSARGGGSKRSRR